MIKRGIVIVLGVALSACLEVEPLIESVKAFCGSAADCPEGFGCTEGACVDPSRCGDGVVQFGEACDDGNTVDAQIDARVIAQAGPLNVAMGC